MVLPDRTKFRPSLHSQRLCPLGVLIKYRHSTEHEEDVEDGDPQFLRLGRKWLALPDIAKTSTTTNIFRPLLDLRPLICLRFFHISPIDNFFLNQPRRRPSITMVS